MKSNQVNQPQKGLAPSEEMAEDVAAMVAAYSDEGKTGKILLLQHEVLN